LAFGKVACREMATLPFLFYREVEADTAVQQRVQGILVWQ